ncbi:MAG: hypothetical protein WAQ33_14345 [Gaiellaceae bacterium]
MEAQRAAAHSNYDPQATYIVMTPPRTIGTGQPVYCGYHTQTTSIDGLATRRSTRAPTARRLALAAIQVRGTQVLR